jgi:hypothetical protein
MADWVTISSLATAGGTLVLAVATFASVRSANRAARVAEIGLLEQRRPVLVQSRLDDPEQKIMFVDTHWVRVGGGRAAAERDGDVIYFAMSLTNIGSGIGVLQSWSVRAGLQISAVTHLAEDEFRPQTRDMYIPNGGIGLWQGALRDPAHPQYAHPLHDRTLRRRHVDGERRPPLAPGCAGPPVISRRGRSRNW